MIEEDKGLVTTGRQQSARERRLDRMQDLNWWRQAVVYQIYPRSFADGNGDGIGDFGGILSRIDYLADLDIDAVWLNPFYPSAWADGGYDVDDYRAVDPAIGSLDEFDAIVAALHSHGVKVIIDIVPNHSSNRHEEFRAALAAAPGSAERDRFIFRDGLGEAGKLPPSDWQSFLGGAAWTRVETAAGIPEQWYLHLFAPQQPDWNWANADVREDFVATLAFWGDRGVDGFRVDTASLLAKDMSEPLPSWAQLLAGNKLLGSGTSPFAEGCHPIEDRAELDVIYAGWRELFDRYEPPLFAVAEAWVEPHRRSRYSSPTSLGQVFDLDLLVAAWNASDYRETIQRSLEFAREADTTATWVMSNHDVVRHVTRLAVADRPFRMMSLPDPADLDRETRELGAARARAATLLMLALPGSAYLYQGEELGLPEVLGIPREEAQDPSARYEGEVAVSGRDGSRVPLPWTATGTSYGFGEGGAWLPQPDWFGRYSVESQDLDEHSSLALYRRALQLRRELQTGEELDWLAAGNSAVAFRRRNGWTSVTNFGPAPVPLPAGDILLRTDPDTPELAANATAWLLQPDERTS